MGENSILMIIGPHIELELCYVAYLSFSYVWNIKKQITTKHYQNTVLVFKNSPEFVCKSENFQKPFNTFF